MPMFIAHRKSRRRRGFDESSRSTVDLPAERSCEVIDRAYEPGVADQLRSAR